MVRLNLVKRSNRFRLTISTAHLNPLYHAPPWINIFFEIFFGESSRNNLNLFCWRCGWPWRKWSRTGPSGCSARTRTRPGCRGGRSEFVEGDVEADGLGSVRLDVRCASWTFPPTCRAPFPPANYFSVDQVCLFFFCCCSKNVSFWHLYCFFFNIPGMCRNRTKFFLNSSYGLSKVWQERI